MAIAKKRRFLRSAAFAIAFALSAMSMALGGCDLGRPPTKVARGELYHSGDGRYDAYFAHVHREQVAAAHWADESRAARKPIIVELHLRPGARASVILRAARDEYEKKQGDGALKTAIEQTASAETERARHLTVQAAKLDEMQKRGEELKREAAEDKKNAGVDKADKKKAAKRDEVIREMAAALDAVETMANDARKGAKEAEELATQLQAILPPREEAPPAPHDKHGKKKPDPSAKKPGPRPPKRPANGERPPPSKGNKPDKPAKPAPAHNQDEVFNP